MNDCGRMEERLNDFVDGELSEAAARDVTAHLEACAACRDTVVAVRSLKAAAAALPGSLAPGRDLWPAIEERIEAGRSGLLPFVPLRRASGTRGATRFWGWPAGLAAAAVVLVAATASITMVLMRGGAGSPEPQVVVTPAGQAVLASFRQAEIDYQRATDDLRAILEQRRGELAPETVALLEENLRVIDAAINQMWTALENDPGRSGNRHLFNSLYQKKVMLLQQAVRLPSQS
ncbi:MAG TPA: zf-HC2 domain-containing protein [Candidatus Polarisedimenticolia bacterium]|nr:zf-HC2 domain-containing protein [Candidatus Polarisedimenticolia bacterium]